MKHKDIPRLCRLWGHDLDPDALRYYGIDYCQRCERQVEGSTGVLRLRELLSVRLWIMRRAVRDRLYGWREWLKCSECGRRFGKHDDRFDHLPF